jgi:hypothetical protein
MRLGFRFSSDIPEEWNQPYTEMFYFATLEMR